MRVVNFIANQCNSWFALLQHICSGREDKNNPFTLENHWSEKVTNWYDNPLNSQLVRARCGGIEPTPSLYLRNIFIPLEQEIINSVFNIFVAIGGKTNRARAPLKHWNYPRTATFLSLNPIHNFYLHSVCPLVKSAVREKICRFENTHYKTEWLRVALFLLSICCSHARKQWLLKS